MESRNAIWRADVLTNAIDLATGGDEDIVLTHEVTGAGARFMAGFLDMVMQGALFALVAVGLVYFRPEYLAGWRLGVLLGGMAMFHVAYFFFFEWVTGGETPGKNMCALRVVGTDGRPVSVGQLFARNALRLVDWLPGFYLLGLLLAVGGRGQRLGDRVAGTVVVFQVSLREILDQAGVAPSVYSTSDDGYMLESFVAREGNLREEVAIPLAHQLAEYLHRKYPPSEPHLINTYERRDYSGYLRELYLAEKEREALP
jgi:uncharacterized RDD family membrane protein YckC